MKNILRIFLIAAILVACKDESKIDSTVIKGIDKEDITTSIYPEAITKVFDAHGGIDQWNRMRILSFTVTKPNGKEVTTTNCILMKRQDKCSG